MLTWRSVAHLMPPQTVVAGTTRTMGAMRLQLLSQVRSIQILILAPAIHRRLQEAHKKHKWKLTIGIMGSHHLLQQVARIHHQVATTVNRHLSIRRQHQVIHRQVMAILQRLLLMASRLDTLHCRHTHRRLTALLHQDTRAIRRILVTALHRLAIPHTAYHVRLLRPIHAAATTQIVGMVAETIGRVTRRKEAAKEAAKETATSASGRQIMINRG